MGSCPSYSLWDSLAIARLACTLAHDSLHFVLVLYVCQVGHKPAEPVRAVTPRAHCYFLVCKIKGAGDGVLKGGLWVGLEGLGRLCVWHRCEQPVGHPLAMAPAWPVCHMQSSCLPGGAWLWAGTAPAEPSPAGHSGEVKSCGSAPWEPSLHSSHERQHFRWLGRASCQTQSRPVTALQDPSCSPHFQQHSGCAGGQGRCSTCCVRSALLQGKRGQLFLWD